MTEGMVTTIVAAIPTTIAAVAACIAGVAARRAARATNQQTTPGNGMLLSKMIEETREDVHQLKNDLSYHITVQHGRGPIPTEVDR